LRRLSAASNSRILIEIQTRDGAAAMKAVYPSAARPEQSDLGTSPSAMIKRFIDVAASAAGLMMLAAILLVVALAIRCQMGSPVFFRQTRPGLNGKPFELVKFRTMREAIGPDGVPLPDAERLTRLGWYLRSWSLDELPQLWNVLKGEMSLVGPRPLLVDYLPLYNAVQTRRHEVRPGLTGWAQVNGRNALSWSEKFDLDIWYVDNQSLWLDFKIMWMTIRKVPQRNGIAHISNNPRPRFRGNDDPAMSSDGGRLN